MSKISFDEYVFDDAGLTLQRRGRPVNLRPKTALILRLLLAQPQQVVEKSDLLREVWSSPLVSDQNLFQAISELRRIFSPLRPIVTYPNRGYCWCLPVTPGACPSPGWRGQGPRAATALVVVLVAALAGLQVTDLTRQPDSSGLSPAIQAFQIGLGDLQDDPQRAADYFRLSLSENPEFLEARLMLAESLALAGQTDSARAEAEYLYVLATEEQQPYLTVSVMTLLSRLDEAAGQTQPAVEWARSALETATSKGFACVASNAQQRLAMLLRSDIKHSRHLPGHQPGHQLAQEGPPAGKGRERGDDSAQASTSGRPAIPPGNVRLMAQQSTQPNERACDPLLGLQPWPGAHPDLKEAAERAV